MKKEITLPSGATVTLRDPDTLKVKDRERIVTASDRVTGETEGVLAMQNTFIAAIIEEWSFDLIVPAVKLSSLGELSPKDYDVIVKELPSYREALFPELTETKESAENADSPFDNSNG